MAIQGVRSLAMEALVCALWIPSLEFSLRYVRENVGQDQFHGLATVALLIFTFGWLFPKQIVNPSVTLTLVASGGLPLLDGMWRLMGQLVGLTVGVYGMHTLTAVRVGLPLIKTTSLNQALLVEVFITYVLCFTVQCNVAAKMGPPWAPLIVSLVAVNLILLASPVSGAAMNILYPAVAYYFYDKMHQFQPMVHVWGPALGALLAALLGRVMFPSTSAAAAAAAAVGQKTRKNKSE